METLQSIYEQLLPLRIQGLGLENGRMGQAILTYELFKETKKEGFRESADSMIDTIVERIENSSLSTLPELPEIGWGFSYLLEKGFLSGGANVLEDFDVIFRNILLDEEAEMEAVISMGLYFCSHVPSSFSLSRAKRSLLLCQQIIAGIFKEKVTLQPQVLLNYFSLLAGLFRLNVFRYKTLKLFLNALYMLQSLEKSPNKIDLRCHLFIVNTLIKNEYIRSFIEKQSPSLYESVVKMKEKYSLDWNCISTASFLYEMDGQIYLVPDDWHCIPLFSLP